MKPGLEQIKRNEATSSLTQRILDLPEFEPFWHFHPEFELTYIIRGRGKRIVGDSVEPFQEGDLVLLGPDLPHTWNSGNNNNKSESCKAVVFQFSHKMLSDLINEFPEFEAIRRLLNIANRGISFHGEQALETRKKLLKLSKSSGLVKLTQFWLILDDLSRSNNYRLLASANYVPSLNKYNVERINSVFSYVTGHFTENISLQKVAGIVHMTQTSFCRFFKMITGETFTEYLNNFRISHACVLLIKQQDRSILQVAYDSGFKSSTHFNRMFLQKKNCTPTGFRRLHLARNRDLGTNRPTPG
ncbi:MAG: AraC family transcriptional regulator [Bacteroidota bacterium]